ncbi:8314_t:CDS:1, partial [Acaulospora morrowiae]
MPVLKKLSLAFLRRTEKVVVKSLREELRQSKIELEEMKHNAIKIQERNRELIDERSKLQKDILELVKKEQWEKRNQVLVELELNKEREQWKKEKEQWEKEKQKLIEEKEQWEKEKQKLIEEKEQWEKEKQKLIGEKEQGGKEKQKFVEFSFRG